MIVKNMEASFIIPTYNSESYIKKCLNSIKKQKYSLTKFEVLVLDGGSDDGTLKIVASYKSTLPIRVLKNEKVDAESAKYKGIMSSKGDIVILLDSDNEIVDSDWLSNGISIMKKHSKLWGIESPWMLNVNDSLINQYFTLLKIADPLARILNPKRLPYRIYEGYDIYRLEKNAVVVTGANGFFWRKSEIIKHIADLEKFEEVNFVSKITQREVSYFVKLKKMGIHHYYCDSLFKYFNKRMKIANKFTKRKELKQKTWLDNVSKAKLFFSIIYCFSIVGPLIEAFVNVVKSRNPAWIFHPAISFVTVMIYTYTVVRRSAFIR